MLLAVWPLLSLAKNRHSGSIPLEELELTVMYSTVHFSLVCWCRRVLQIGKPLDSLVFGGIEAQSGYSIMRSRKVRGPCMVRIPPYLGTFVSIPE